MTSATKVWCRERSYRLSGTGETKQNTAIDEDDNDIHAHKRGIRAWFDRHISIGKVEGIKNKVKVMEIIAYGFRNEEYFKLRLYALHDYCITQNVCCFVPLLSELYA